MGVAIITRKNGRLSRFPHSLRSCVNRDFSRFAGPPSGLRPFAGKSRFPHQTSPQRSGGEV